MIVETTRFGQLEVNPDKVITLEHGLIGIPWSHRFILMEHVHGGPFQWLQSLDDPALAFVVVDPMLYFPEYTVEVPDDEVERLRIHSAADVQVLTTITIRVAARQVTANLLGPIVIGVESRQGAQLVLDGDRYTTQHAFPTRQRPEPARVLQPA